MTTLIAFHEVDDVDHWLPSPKREVVFGPLGIIRAFVDPGEDEPTGSG
jgi:antibiotic biosynthesis monooxygenase (ABM) superfamily enzyme